MVALVDLLLFLPCRAFFVKISFLQSDLLLVGGVVDKDWRIFHFSWDIANSVDIFSTPLVPLLEEEPRKWFWSLWQILNERVVRDIAAPPLRDTFQAKQHLSKESRKHIHANIITLHFQILPRKKILPTLAVVMCIARSHDSFPIGVSADSCPLNGPWQRCHLILVQLVFLDCGL